jgi:hypothetical protein
VIVHIATLEQLGEQMPQFLSHPELALPWGTILFTFG